MCVLAYIEKDIFSVCVRLWDLVQVVGQTQKKNIYVGSMNLIQMVQLVMLIFLFMWK